MSHPRCVQMMDGNGTFLGVHARAEHTRRAEQYADCPIVHSRDERLSCPVGLNFLNEAYLLSGNAVVFHQFAFDFAVGIPFTGLISAEVAEHKLRSFLLIELAVVLRNLGGKVGFPPSAPVSCGWQRAC